MSGSIAVWSFPFRRRKFSSAMIFVTWSVSFFCYLSFLLNNFGGHKSFLWGHWYTPVLVFWWRLLWVSKPEWAALFILGGGMHVTHFPKIHLLCDFCWPLESQAILFHVPVSRHWWGSKLGSIVLPLWSRHSTDLSIPAWPFKFCDFVLQLNSDIFVGGWHSVFLFWSFWHGYSSTYWSSKFNPGAALTQHLPLPVILASKDILFGKIWSRNCNYVFGNGSASRTIK